MRGGWQPPLPDMPAPPPARAWGRLTPPLGYEPQWRRLVEAALEQGLGPDALAETGLDPIAAARDWKPATVALYSKVARYAGAGGAHPPAPDPAPPPPPPPLGYETEWGRVGEAAPEQGLGPGALGGDGPGPIAPARGWKPGAGAFVHKVPRYGGVGVAQPPTPEPDPPTLDLRELTRVRS